MANVTEIMQMCRLCLVKEEVNVPIFEGAGDIRQILEKIKRCLPVKVDLGDNLPKKICEGCVYKLDLCYQFYNKASQSEKQLLTWLTATDDVSVDSKARIPAAIEEIVVSPTQIVKEEPITESYENQFNNFYEGTNYRDAPETITASELSLGENEEPPVKKRKKTAAYASSSAVTDSDEDADDPIDTTITKTEDESDEEEDDENEDLDSTEAEPAFVDVSQEASTDVQPGPSGIQKPGDSQLDLSCKKCNKIFANKDKLWKHARVHKEKTMQCPHCPKMFSLNFNLRSHVKKAHRDPSEIIHCQYCDKKMTNAQSYENHVRAHFNDFDFHCNECGTKYSTKDGLAQHVDSVHKGIRYDCEICGKKYTRITQLKEHQKTHDPLYSAPDIKCEYCDYVAHSKSSYYTHIRKHTGKQKRFICELCNKEFTSNKSLKDHTRIHNNERPYSCDTCGKSFTQKNVLMNHQRVHTKERPFTCEQCGKSFAQKTALQTHKRSHTGERPYACHVCHKKFITRSAQVAHHNRHKRDGEL